MKLLLKRDDFFEKSENVVCFGHLKDVNVGNFKGYYSLFSDILWTNE